MTQLCCPRNPTHIDFKIRGAKSRLSGSLAGSSSHFISFFLSRTRISTVAAQYILFHSRCYILDRRSVVYITGIFRMTMKKSKKSKVGSNK
ncbi:hypothetical protein ACTXT7_007515 [Hymenolepis weldensis]